MGQDITENIVIEHAKSQIDYVKHITTLSTGSILILATFLEKVFEAPHWKTLVVISFLGFILSVVCAVVAHTLLIGNKDMFVEPDISTGAKAYSIVIVLLVMWISFLVGIISLGVFAIKNVS